METIISAAISAGAAIIVCMISQNRLVSLIEYRLEQLEKKHEKFPSFGILRLGKNLTSFVIRLLLIDVDGIRNVLLAPSEVVFWKCF